MKSRWIISIGAILAGCLGAADLPEVPIEAVDGLGITVGTPQMTGFVFIEGRYLQAPYTVTRRGNGLFINRVQFEQPVAWSAVSASAGAETVAVRKTADGDGDFQEVAAVPAPTAAPEAEPAKPKTVKSIDDLFADETPAAAAPAAKATAPDGGEAAAVQPPAAPSAVASAAAQVTRTPEDIQRMKDDLRANLDNLRKGYEQALARGEVFFFGQRHNRVNGNYGTARALMGVLPQALRQAQSPQDLMQLLNRGGIYFLDMGICTAIYRNKNTFPLLAERLERIEENERSEALRRSERSAVR